MVKEKLSSYWNILCLQFINFYYSGYYFTVELQYLLKNNEDGKQSITANGASQEGKLHYFHDLSVFVYFNELHGIRTVHICMRLILGG